VPLKRQRLTLAAPTATAARRSLDAAAVLTFLRLTTTAPAVLVRPLSTAAALALKPGRSILRAPTAHANRRDLGVAQYTHTLEMASTLQWTLGSPKLTSWALTVLQLQRLPLPPYLSLCRRRRRRRRRHHRNNA